MEKIKEITRDLRIVIPVQTEKHGLCYAYSLPLSRLIFETYCLELGATYSACFDGFNPKHIAMTAPQMALPVLMATSKRMGTWEGPDGVQMGLVNEIERLTTVAHATESGWQQIPLPIARSREILDEDSHAEVLSSLCFFLLSVRVGPKALLDPSLSAAGSPRGWRHTSSDFSGWLASLKTSTPKPDTTKKRSSVAS